MDDDKESIEPEGASGRGEISSELPSRIVWSTLAPKTKEIRSHQLDIDLTALEREHGLQFDGSIERQVDKKSILFAEVEDESSSKFVVGDLSEHNFASSRGAALSFVEDTGYIGGSHNTAMSIIGNLARLAVTLVCIPFITISSMDFAYSFKDHLEIKAQAKDVKERLEGVQGEHSWLKGIGIAKDVYVGILKKEEVKTASSGFYTKRHIISNFENFILDGILSSSLSLTGIVKDSSAVHMGIAMNKMTSDFSKYVVRHEIAHAIQKDKKIALQDVYLAIKNSEKQPIVKSNESNSSVGTKVLPSGESTTVSNSDGKKILSSESMDVFQKILESYDYGMSLKAKNWQINYLHGLFTEGFADAHSLLIKTKAPDYKSGHLRQEALLQMRGRTYGFFENSRTALNTSGEDHSVQDVGFVLAQLPEDVIKNMTTKQIETLSASISFKAMIVSLARDSSAIDFFDEKNKDLLFHSIKNGGVELERSKFYNFWEELKSLVLYVEDEKLLGVNFSNHFAEQTRDKYSLNFSNKNETVYDEVKESEDFKLRSKKVKKEMPSFMTEDWVIRVPGSDSDIEFSGVGYPLDPLGSWRYSGYGSQMVVVTGKNGNVVMKSSDNLDEVVAKNAIWRANFEHLWLCELVGETCILNIKDARVLKKSVLDSLGVASHWFVEDNYVAVESSISDNLLKDRYIQSQVKKEEGSENINVKGSAGRTVSQNVNTGVVSAGVSAQYYKEFKYVTETDGKIDAEHSVFVKHNSCKNEFFKVVDKSVVSQHLSARAHLKVKVLPAIVGEISADSDFGSLKNDAQSKNLSEEEEPKVKNGFIAKSLNELIAVKKVSLHTAKSLGDLQEKSGNNNYKESAYYQEAKKLEPNFLPKKLLSYRANNNCKEIGLGNTNESMLNDEKVSSNKMVRTKKI